MISILEMTKYVQRGKVLCQEQRASKLGSQDMDPDLLSPNLISSSYSRLFSCEGPGQFPPSTSKPSCSLRLLPTQGNRLYTQGSIDCSPGP